MRHQVTLALNAYLIAINSSHQQGPGRIETESEPKQKFLFRLLQVPLGFRWLERMAGLHMGSLQSKQALAGERGVCAHVPPSSRNDRTSVTNPEPQFS
jgi:hypothetical protein